MSLHITYSDTATDTDTYTLKKLHTLSVDTSDS